MAAPQPASTPGRSRGFSVKSDHSNKTSASGHKSHLSESSQEKARRSLHTKADPLVAMNELQPNLVALEKSNLGSLRAIQHKDQFGNPITDPDLSNPTRPRLERPLDTIRSFEAAIYGTYTSQRPNSYARTGSLCSARSKGPQADYYDCSVDDAASQMGDFSRRTSYYGHNPQASRGYGEQNGYYGRGNQSRPDSFIDYGASSSQAPESHYPYNQNNGQRRPRPQPRVSTDQNAYINGNGANGHYTPQQNYSRSYDNVTALSGSGSGSSDPYGHSTDPSSLNNSMDQLQQQALQQQRMDERAQAEYGFSGFGAGPNMNGKGMPMAPPPAASPSYGQPPKQPAVNVVRKPANQNEKRKSWFKRRFSKD